VDLTRIRPVFEQTGPFVTVHVEVGRTTPTGQDEQESRWTRIRHDLEHAGAEADLTATIGERVLENTHLPGEVRRTIVATRERVVFDDVQPGRSAHPEVLDHGDLPDLAAWLAAEDQAVPFVLAVVNREGADIEVHRAVAKPPQDRETVEGETFHITKVPQGDWAQKQFQQTAENVWHHNARLVAEEVRSLARTHGTRAVLVAGEVRARAEVRHALDQHGLQELGAVIEVESGGRAAGSSDEALWAEVQQRLAGMTAAADAEVANRLDEARGRGEGAATGLDEVLGVLAKAQVERLVVDLDAVRDEVVSPGRHPGLALPEPAASAEQLPADRVLVAAAALTDAQLTLLPAAMARGGGVSALLRWAE
jgi:hypothetical protein